MGRLAGFAISAAVFLGGSDLSIGAPLPSGCTHEGGDPRAYLDCLNNRQKTAERRLDQAVSGALAAIDGRADLQPAQRKRWRVMFEEAQSRFVQWRNFECQSIAPFEGGGPLQSVGGRIGGIGMLEQRMICLIAQNEARTANLAERYGPPGGWPEPAPVVETPAPAPAEAASSEPVAPTGTPRIIEMP